MTIKLNAEGKVDLSPSPTRSVNIFELAAVLDRALALLRDWRGDPDVDAFLRELDKGKGIEP